MKSKKKAISTILGLASLCAITLWANNYAFKETDEISGLRIPAGAEKAAVFRNTELEHALARKLASLGHRKTASLGKLPDMVEQVRFEVLQGKYAVQLEGDKIAHAEYVDSPATDAYPTFIDDRLAFLKKYGKVLGTSNDRVQLARMEIQGSKTVEIYQVGSKDVKFVLDPLNRVLEIAVENAN